MGVLDTIRFLPLLLDNQSYTKYLCILNQKLANSSQAKLSSFSLDKRAKGLASFFFFFFYQYDENLFFFLGTIPLLLTKAELWSLKHLKSDNLQYNTLVC